MIRHCVFLRFRAAVARAEREALYAALAALRTELPGMLSFRAGPNASPEGLGKGFDEGFIADFLDVAARDTYLANSTHQAIGARIAAATEGGAEGIFVFDLDILAVFGLRPAFPPRRREFAHCLLQRTGANCVAVIKVSYSMLAEELTTSLQ